MTETKPTRRSRVSNGKTLFLDGDKGTKAERRFRDIAEAITADLGGADRLSEGQKQLIRRCSLISVECEKMEAKSVAGEEIDVDLFGTLTDRLGRTLQRLGLRRVPKVIGPPDLQEYLRDRENASCRDAPGSPPDSHLDLGCPVADRNLLGAALGDMASWSTWLSVLKASFGDALSTRDREVFARGAGNRSPPSPMVRELWAIIGRRGGKSRVAAAISAYIATCIDHSGKLSPGETGMVLVLASTTAQAKAVFNYILAFVQASPVLAQQIEAVTANEIRLRGDIAISVHSNSFRSVRGRTLLAVVFDEVAFWRDETSSQPDIETYRAVLPALATTSGMLIAISSPYRRLGLLHQTWRDYYGQDGDDVLVVQGPTATFNPLMDTSVVDRARRDDPTSALAEWDAEFRSDLSQFLDDDTIDGAIDHGRPLELPPREGVTYFGFVDASAGRHDAFCIGIVHAEATEDREASAPKRLIADVVRGVKPPFDPKSVAQEFAKLAKDYGIGALTGDQYAGQWVAGAFQDAGIDYQASPLPKSQLYLEGLPHFMRGLVSIPDQPQLLRELRLLERRTARSGKDSVDHGQSGSDDFANVLFGALYLAAGKREQHIPMAAPFVVSRPYDFPSSDGDMQNPAIGRGVHSGGESAMERFAGGARPGNGYEWPI